MTRRHADRLLRHRPPADPAARRLARRLLPVTAALTLLSGIAAHPQAQDVPQAPQDATKSGTTSPAPAEASPPARAPAPQIPAPDARAAEVPEGYRVEVAIASLMYPSSIEFDGAGALYVAECGYMPGDVTQPARILKFTGLDLAGEGLGTAHREVVATDLQKPITDLLWHDGRLYISHKGRISVLEDGAVRDLVTGLPSFGDHSNNQLALGPDGKLYFGQGSATNSGVVGADNFAFGWPQQHPEVCEIPARDIVLAGQDFESVDPRAEVPGPLVSGADKVADEDVARADGRQPSVTTSAFQPFGVTAPAGTVIHGSAKANSAILRMDTDGSHLEVYAWGFRNPYGVLWADGQLYVADAGSDERGSRPIANAPEKLFRVVRDGWYGWPDYEGGIPVTEPRFASRLGPAPQFLMQEHPPVEAPWLTLEAHASVTQLDVARGAAFGHEGELFVAASGDQSPVTAAEDVRAGYWVKRIDTASGEASTFFRTRPDALGPPGLEYVETAGPKRLVDLRFTPFGDALYVVDIGPIHYVRGGDGPEAQAFPGTGVIWRITREPAHH
jgi:glucose/arabinose dehydrogenase